MTSPHTTASFADLGDLGRVSAAQVLVLLKVLSSATYRDRTYLEGRYSEQARFFPETLRLLESVAWAVDRNGAISLTVAGEAAAALLDAPAELRRLLVLDLIRRGGYYRDACAAYLSKFRLVSGELTYAPAGSERLQDTEVRDFLMTMDVVERSGMTDRFGLSALGRELYLWATAFNRSTTSETILNGWVSRTELGRAAELAVLAYEKQRVGSAFASLVQHVADEWPTAPYDIKSVTVVDERVDPRFIEVKGVSESDWHFYWSAGEVAVARLMRSDYFLYLVPCSNRPRIEHLRIISDPTAHVLGEGTMWHVEPSVLSCALRAAHS